VRVSVKFVVWLRISDGVPSERPPRLEKERFGGP